MPIKHYTPYTLVILYSLLGSSIIVSDGFGQWLRSDWKKNVFPIERIEVKASADSVEYHIVGTGILILYKNINYIVTNKHIAQMPNLSIGINTKDPNLPIIHYHFDTMIALTKEHWRISDVFDIAAIRLGYPSSWGDTLDILSIGVSLFKPSSEVFEGAEVYVLGFPLGIGVVTKGKYSPVYRGGIVALKERNEEFLIDSNIFPGNSGGPVFTAPQLYNPEAGSIISGGSAAFIGIVYANITYIDEAYSLQTQRKRVTFEENSGLAKVISSDVIREFLEEYQPDR